MSPDDSQPTTAITPVTDLDDARAITLLTTEHWSLLSARQLAYNEAFTRGGMFLTFLSMSFVALALLADTMSIGPEFLPVAAIVLTFDLVIGVTTYGRILGANADDLRAVHGMARIRHSYAQISPPVTTYFTAPFHDDPDSVNTTYGSPAMTQIGAFLYGLTTSSGMIGLITAMVGGVLSAVLGIILGASGGVVVWIGLGGAALVFGVLFGLTTGYLARYQATLSVLFPAPGRHTGADRARDPAA